MRTFWMLGLDDDGDEDAAGEEVDDSDADDEPDGLFRFLSRAEAAAVVMAEEEEEDTEEVVDDDVVGNIVNLCLCRR